MATVTRYASGSIDDVFAVIADPTTYPEWLVGARAIRAIDEGWPRPGTKFHHRVGLVGPITVDDHTESLEVDPPRHLALEARFRPFGRARVEFSLREMTPANGCTRTRIDMTELLVGPFAVANPVAMPAIAARNRASLNALVAYLNEPR
ncbi:MAG: hypothetical protein JWN46_740 [Acidimicrobiales bacterium]|nr:hypothetical protein [Acidimicrobiales bacterium]